MHLVCTRDLAIGDVEGAAGKEAYAALGFGGFVFGQGVERVRFVFVVADIAVTEDDNMSGTTCSYMRCSTHPLPAGEGVSASGGEGGRQSTNQGRECYYRTRKASQRPKTGREQLS